ncbi:MAG TPA: hypothetical protein VLB69_01630 [Rudaea sp.]|nr:hypothetical protein [Rudaea sp.]
MPVFGTALALFAGAAGAGNLVTNPDFDSGLTGWTLVAPAGTLSLDNSDGSPSAPSLHLVAFTAASGAQVESDCIAIDNSQNVDLYANVNVHTGNQNVSVDAWSSADCSTGSLGTAGSASLTPASDTWQEESNLAFALPGTTQSVRVVLTAGPTFGADVSDVKFDHLQFGPAGTTPVTLQSFDVE